MEYAESLLSGFDNNVDDVIKGDDMKPDPVDIRKAFHFYKELGKGISS